MVLRILLFVFICSISVQQSYADNPPFGKMHIRLKHKKCYLSGKWLLTSTYMQNKTHEVDSAEYKGFITFKRLHKYREEASYEGYHWIITGKWHIQKHSNNIIVTKRHYILQELEKNPADLQYELQALTKTNWTAETTDKGVVVKVTYKKIGKK